MLTRFLMLVVILSAFLIEARGVRGQQPEPAPKTYKFPMDHKPWKEVLDYLGETTGKPVITVHAPTGKFPCLDLANKEFTIPELVDIINEALRSQEETQKYYLVTRERSFTLVPTDEKIDIGGLLPRILVKDLNKHVNTEIVSIVLELQSLDAEVVAPYVKKLMGPLSEAIPMVHPGVNKIILVDTVGYLKRICKMLEEGHLRMPAAPVELRRRTDSRFGQDARFDMVGSGRETRKPIVDADNNKVERADHLSFALGDPRFRRSP